ncbi:hypothetical protein ACTFIU_005866 [Dictyostelium citrinum]
MHHVDKKLRKSASSIISNAIFTNDLHLTPTIFSKDFKEDYVEIVVDHYNQDSILKELIEKQKSIDRFDRQLNSIGSPTICTMVQLNQQSISKNIILGALDLHLQNAIQSPNFNFTSLYLNLIIKLISMKKMKIEIIIK